MPNVNTVDVLLATDQQEVKLFGCTGDAEEEAVVRDHQMRPDGSLQSSPFPPL